MEVLLTASFCLRTICEVLGNIQMKWYKVGIALGIPAHKLDEFKGKEDPLSAVVDCWLKGNVASSLLPLSWKSIVDVLKSDYVGEPGLAENIKKKYQNTKIGVLDYGSAIKDGPTPSSPEDKIREDISYHLQKNLKEIVKKYAFYVDCLRSIIERKGVQPEALKSFLLSLPAFKSSCEINALTLLSDKEAELNECYTITSIFTFLTTKCASFLNYDIFESIAEYYKVDTKEDVRLNYSSHVKAYVNKHTVSEFSKINPQLKLDNGSEELILKFNVEESCRLAKVMELKQFLADILDLSPSTLHIVDIKDGCVIVTFHISASIADYILLSDTMSSLQQRRKVLEQSVLYIKCRDITSVFEEEGSKELLDYQSTTETTSCTATSDHSKEMTRPAESQAVIQTDDAEVACRKCRNEMRLSNLDNHLKNECEHRVVSCEFEHLGCEFKSSEVMMRKHAQESMQNHLLLLSRHNSFSEPISIGEQDNVAETIIILFAVMVISVVICGFSCYQISKTNENLQKLLSRMTETSKYSKELQSLKSDLHNTNQGMKELKSLTLRDSPQQNSIQEKIANFEKKLKSLTLRESPQQNSIQEMIANFDKAVQLELKRLEDMIVHYHQHVQSMEASVADVKLDLVALNHGFYGWLMSYLKWPWFCGPSEPEMIKLRTSTTIENEK